MTCGTGRAAGGTTRRTRAARTASRRRCRAARWPARGRTGRPTRPRRSVGGLATLRSPTGIPVVHGLLSKPTGTTDRVLSQYYYSTSDYVTEFAAMCCGRLPECRVEGARCRPADQRGDADQVGFEYIKGTYGSPCGAWDHEQATGWYWSRWYRAARCRAARPRAAGYLAARPRAAGYLAARPRAAGYL